MLGACVHEAGHAVAAELLGLRVREVSVEANGDGLCQLEPSPCAAQEPPAAQGPQLSAEQVEALIAQHRAAVSDPLAMIADRLRGILPDAEVRDRLVQSMAGRIAQARVTSEPLALSGADGDLRTERMLTFMLSERANVPLELANCRQRARDLVAIHWPAITTLAARLMAKRKLTGDDMRTLLREWIEAAKALNAEGAH